jgi:RimJ/RimL family protein N-acetyltransferase
MVGVLDDVRLHTFMGGCPLTLPELRERYVKLISGSLDETQTWLNWVIRAIDSHEALGTMQATVVADTADIAWVVGVRWQSQGFATEATRGLVAWLVSQGVRTVRANIHPGHVASERVAERAGLAPTSRWLDGERVWSATPE